LGGRHVELSEAPQPSYVEPERAAVAVPVQAIPG
jgi:hypothetical protein